MKIKEVRGNGDQDLGELTNKISTLSDEFYRDLQDLKKTVEDEFIGRSREEANKVIKLAEDYTCKVTSKITEVMAILEKPMK